MLSGWAHTYKSKEYTHLRNSATLKWGLQGYNCYGDTTVIDLQSRGLHRLHSWFMRWWYGNWFRCTVGETVDIQIVDSRVCHDCLCDDLAVLDLHVHEMEHRKSIPDYFSWVWIPIQGHLWRHSEVRESEKKKTHIVSGTLRLTSRINSRLFAHGLSFAMHTWERRTKAACPFPNQTRLLNKIELVYVYAYTDGEPPSQLTVSFGLLGGVVSTDNPITVRSQSDLQSDHSPITVRSYVLPATWDFHRKKRIPFQICKFCSGE